MINSTQISQSPCNLQWTDRDDQTLLQGIQYHGDNWERVAGCFKQSRTSIECQNRYHHFWKKFYTIRSIQLESSQPIKVLSVSQRADIQLKLKIKTTKSEIDLPAAATVNLGLGTSKKRKSDGDLPSRENLFIKKERKEKCTHLEERCLISQHASKQQGNASSTSITQGISPLTVASPHLNDVLVFSDDELAEFLNDCLFN